MAEKLTILHIDFETYSACELRDRGLDNYATDPSTGVHCLGIAWDDESAFTMSAQDFWQQEIVDVCTHIAEGGLVYAHNAAFELAVWNNICVPRFGWPVLKPEQCRCTMAMAYAMALPGALENVAPALGIDQRKDAAGKRVMLKLAKPKLDGTFHTPQDNPDDFQKLYDYCKQDVEVERAVHKRMVELSDEEQALWVLDYKINQRGIQVDTKAIDAAIGLVESEKARLDALMLKATGGVVGRCTEVQLLVKWIRLQGVEIPGLAKADVLDGLAGELPANVRRAMELRQEAAKSSTAKLVAMKERASNDGRVRGIHQYHGASTGRWAGRGIQTQNFPRPRVGIKPKHVDDIIGHLHQREYIDAMYGPVMDALADSLRGMLIAKPGHELIAADFSAIEARVLAWLAGQESVLDIFRNGDDIYKHAAAAIFRVPYAQIDKDQRQIGKVAVLALGYGGGVGAFQSMARAYGLKIPDAEADAIKLAWREAHPRIVRYWYALEEAAVEALHSGDLEHAGPLGRRVQFKMRGSFLWCRLPSGRVLCYPYPEMMDKETPWGEIRSQLSFMTVNGTTNKCERTTTYGGSLAENVTQAVARDLLAHGMTTLESRGYNVVAHVHDECVVEIETRCDSDTLQRIETLMAQTPSWATGLPVTAEGWRARRYRK